MLEIGVLERSLDIRRINTRVLLLSVAALLVALLLPATGSGYIMRLFLFAFIWGGIAVSWTLFSGYTGYISFGHSLFFGIGAFTSTILYVDYGITPWAGMLLGAIFSALVALGLGLIILPRLSGIYFGLATLAFPMAVFPFLRYLEYLDVTIPFNADAPFFYMTFRNVHSYYYIALALLLLTLVVTWRVKTGQIGRYLQAIKENETAAKHLGIETEKYKLLTYMLSAFLTAPFGTVYVATFVVFTPESTFGLDPVIQSVVLSIIGGLTTVIGPALAAILLYPLSNVLRISLGTDVVGLSEILYGIVLIITIFYFPEGLWTNLRELRWSDVRERLQAVRERP